jgi:hypothetical protein
VMSGMTYVVASPALAACNAECQEQKAKEKEEAQKQREEEKAAAKKQKEEGKEAIIREKREASGIGDPWGVNDFHAYKHCPYENTELSDCFTGITAGGKKGGFFQYGQVKVPLDKSIKLQGGFKGEEASVEISPELINGGETLEAPLLDVEGGIAVITPLIQAEAKWPTALTEAFNEAKKHKETVIDTKIELAGTELYEIPGSLDTEHILEESGVAFKLPLKVKVTGPFLEKLGGGPCYLGSDENPIHINLTTEGQGGAGHVEFNNAFTNIFLQGSRLVDFGWHIPIASGAKGCGGAYEEYVDRALNIALEVETPQGSEIKGKKGMVVLEGNLHDGNRKFVQQAAEEGKV